jgi:hypothetical protein
MSLLEVCQYDSWASAEVALMRDFHTHRRVRIPNRDRERMVFSAPNLSLRVLYCIRLVRVREERRAYACYRLNRWLSITLDATLYMLVTLAVEMLFRFFSKTEQLPTPLPPEPSFLYRFSDF